MLHQQFSFILPVFLTGQVKRRISISIPTIHPQFITIFQQQLHNTQIPFRRGPMQWRRPPYIADIYVCAVLQQFNANLKSQKSFEDLRIIIFAIYL